MTLQIVKALIDKCPRDLALYANSVLQVLTIILRSRDVNLVEESVPTFDAFCIHYMSATLSADQDNTRQFDEIVQMYCAYASKTRAQEPRAGAGSIPESIRLRTASLLAIKSLVSSDSFGLDNGTQLNRVMPVILETLYTSRRNHLAGLQQLDEANDKNEKDQAYKRRQSVSAPRESQNNEADPSAASATVADLDQRADENIGVLALQSLKQIFTANNRGLLRQATSAVLRFTTSEAQSSEKRSATGASESLSSAWMYDIFERISRWAPVQDRFIILVIVVEALLQSPINEGDLVRQIGLVTTVGTLLRSDINFIGLSVLDVLIGLIHHTLLLLQLGGSGSRLQPHPQQSDGTTSPIGAASNGNTSKVTMEVVKTPSPPRILLLEHLQHCIGDLATHIYYSDQVGDIVSALLLRLKPSPTSAISSPVSAVENPSGAADAIAAAVNLRNRSDTDDFFSFDTARVIALNAVKEVIIVANSKRKDGTNPAGRNRVDVSVWDGTQWLLRDSDGRVRKAYIDALLTWLALEVEKKDLRIAEENIQVPKKSDGKHANGLHHGFGSTATISAAQKSRVQRSQSSFLQLLHLAVYENAIQYAYSESDFLLLHLLLTRLVEKLGVNSVKYGLPMIFRLQENIMASSDPAELISVGSLVHGYLWALSEAFDFDTTPVGRAIHGEITRRSQHNIWLQDVRVPPLPMERIPVPPTGVQVTRQSMKMAQAMSPFEAREDLVDAIADSYLELIMPPPTSPPLSAGRTFSVSVARPTASAPSINQELPAEVREQMLTPWTKEMCIAAVEKEAAGSIVNYGSRRGNPAASLVAGAHSPGHARSLHELRQLSVGSGPLLTTGLINEQRRNVSPGGLVTPLSSDNTPSVTRVAALKQVLAGNLPAAPSSTRGIGRSDDVSDTTSDSMVPDSFTTSEHSLSLVRNTTNSGSSRGNIPAKNENRPSHQMQDDNVPPLPYLFSSGTVNVPASSQHVVNGHIPKDKKSGGTLGRTTAGKIDASQLLNGINVPAMRSASGGMTKPPY